MDHVQRRHISPVYSCTHVCMTLAATDEPAYIDAICEGELKHLFTNLSGRGGLNSLFISCLMLVDTLEADPGSFLISCLVEASFEEAHIYTERICWVSFSPVGAFLPASMQWLYAEERLSPN